MRMTKLFTLRLGSEQSPVVVYLTCLGEKE